MTDSETTTAQVPPSQALLGTLLPPGKWDEKLATALDHWRQGDLVPCPPLSWAAPAGVRDPVTQQQAPADAHLGLVAMSHPAPPQWAIVTSQTCDVGAGGPGGRHPFVQVSPVIPFDADEPEWDSLQGFEVTDRVGLQPPTLGGAWVADLRMSVPVSKAILGQHTPVRGFPDDDLAVVFGQHLAARAGRPALHDFISSTMVAALRTAIRSSKSGSGWWSKVVQLGVLVAGERLHPTAITLLVLTSTALDPAEQDRWVQLCRGWNTEVKKLSRPFAVNAPYVDRYAECPVATAAPAVMLYVPELRRT